MEYLQKILKKTGMISILESIIFIIIGAVLVWKAEFVIKVISFILGTFFIVLGIIKVVEYFKSHRENFELYNYNLIYGIMSIVIGAITIYYSQTIETILRIIIGIWIIYSSIVKLSLALKIKETGATIWIYSLILSIIMFICGLYIILNSGTIIATIGIVMIIYSVIDIIQDIICIENLDDLL